MTQLDRTQADLSVDVDPLFDAKSEQSRAKSEIVAKYFRAWTRVITSVAKRGRNHRIAYIDLFAGPGRYKDDSKSTALLVLEQAIADPDFCQMLIFFLNDKDSDKTHALKAALDALPGIDRLKLRPHILTTEVDQELAKVFAELKLVPTLSFIDPFGYKGVSLALLESLFKDWGSDCIFFFNYNRINMGIRNDFVEQHMAALFGAERLAGLKEVCKKDLEPAKREALIMRQLEEALVALGGKYVLRFAFKRGGRTSHYLVFVCKAFLGYEIMKGVMANASSKSTQGVASFSFDPADEGALHQQTLFGPLDALQLDLVSRFAGQRLTMREIYEEHTLSTPYILTNYKDALKNLEAQDKIKPDRPASKRRPGTFADSIIVQFPKETLRWRLWHAS
jgi:three-Cys-motif partner protein